MILSTFKADLSQSLCYFEQTFIYLVYNKLEYDGFLVRQ